MPTACQGACLYVPISTLTSTLCFSQSAFLYVLSSTLTYRLHFAVQHYFPLQGRGDYTFPWSAQRSLQIPPQFSGILTFFCCLPVPCGALICSCCAESWASLCVWVWVYISLKWTSRADSLQTAVLFTSCYPLAQTDRPTKDDKAQKLQ